MNSYTFGSSYNYSIRFNCSGGPQSDVYNTLSLFPRTDPIRTEYYKAMNKYKTNGFTYIQWALDNAIL